MNIPLSIPLWLPLAAAVLALALPRLLGGVLVLSAMGLVAGWALGTLIGWDGDTDPLQNVTDISWIPQLGVHYKLGLTGLNIALIALTAILFLICLAWALSRSDMRLRRQYTLFFALAEVAVLGAFLAQDLLLFVVFFDLMLVPFLFLGIGWGPGARSERSRAIVRMFIYTLVGSLLMLAAAITTAVIAQAGPDGSISFALSDLQSAIVPDSSQHWIFLCFAAAFLIKMPAFPFHAWMPDGYNALPLPALAVFSAVLSKVAAYGFLAIALPLMPAAGEKYQTLMLILAVISILYGSMMAFTTTSARLVLGYSSIAQVGFITLGIFALNHDGTQGALLHAVNHGLIVTPAFVLVAYLADRAGSEDLREMGGLAFRAPVLATLASIVALGLLAMPGFPGFIGELYILFGVFSDHIAVAIIASAGIALAAVYGLRLLISAFHNRGTQAEHSRELSLVEGATLVPLVLIVIALALTPQFLLSRSDSAAQRSVDALTPLAQQPEVTP